MEQKNRGQGAIEWPAAAAGTLHAQGATEYLVLLAVVLIIALVTLALLSFFPGMASDSQMAESQLYWQSASPLAVTRTGPAHGIINFQSNQSANYSSFYFVVRNNANYPVRITKILGQSGQQISKVAACDPVSGMCPTIDLSLNIAPGEEACFGNGGDFYGACSERLTLFRLYDGSASTTFNLRAASQLCDAAGRGNLVLPVFGFEYVQTVENQQITKQFLGAKPMLVKCAGVCTNAFFNFSVPQCWLT